MAATEVAESDEENNNHSPWKEILRKMLPPGAPTPDQDHLDYSIAVEYHGPLPSHPLPKVNPINFDDSSSIASSSKVSHFFPSESVAKEFQLKNLVNANGIDSSHCSTNDSETNSNLDSNSLFSSQIRPKSENLVFRREDMMLSESHLNANENEVEVKKVKFDSETEMKSDDDDDDDDGRLSQCSSIASVTALPVVQGERKRNKKRGICSRCGKGNRLSEREICIVCNAKYCSCCLIKAMGSMPEGRKCVGCIGQPIDESKRECLGKVSKILKKVCSSLEVKRITRAERECFANQLRPEQLVVNGRHVVAEEMVELLGCWMPPQNLKPGKYWYDKDSGLWGKEGEKPDKFISSKLNVGGKLQASASNGNTKVFFNGREITKVELRVLKLAKVQCPEATHFWVYDDGSYEEEGQNNIKGNIWEKASTRFLSSLLSLPVPPGKFDGPKDDSTLSSDRLEAEYPEHKRIHKFLLFGLSGSGTSTIFKQAKFLYGDKFTPEELQNIKLMIQSNLYKYLGVLLEGREGFEEESLMKGKDAVTVDLGLLPDEENQCVYSMNPRLKEHADWLLEIMTTGDLDAFFPAATREYAPLVEELWQHRSIQETYRRRGELNFLTDAAKYFLDRAVEISSNDYEPSEKDIIYAEGVTQTNGLVSVEFSFDDRNTASVYYDETVGPLPTLTTYQLVRINSSGLNYGCKWLELFEDVRAVIFCVALSDYDVMWATHFTDSTCNKMLASRDMFVSLVQHPSFRDIPCVLLMNKYDVFEQKISQVPLTVCEWFEDFCPAKLHSNYQSLAHQAYYYVAVKFKELYASVTGQKLYVYQTRALDRTSVNEALRYVQEVIKWDEARDDFLYSLMADDSFDSTDLM